MFYSLFPRQCVWLTLTTVWFLCQALAFADDQLPQSVTNSLGMKLVAVSEGTFEMGSADTQDSLAAAGFQKTLHCA